CYLFFFFALPLPPKPTLFPYTTLFRSRGEVVLQLGPLPPRRPLFVVGHVTPGVDHAVDRAAATQHGARAHEQALLPAVLLWGGRSEEHTSELQSRENLVCRLLLEKKNH